MQVDEVKHIRRCGYCNMLFGSKDEFESICPECMRIMMPISVIDNDSTTSIGEKHE